MPETEKTLRLVPLELRDVPDELRDFPPELKRIEREPSSGKTSHEKPDGRTRDWRVGVALSGGGIRSATLSLGIFQGLAESKLLECVDYLSTVSGGGYFGSFLGHLFARDDAALNTVAQEQVKRANGSAQQQDRRAVVEEILRDPRSGPVEALRENGRYLAPRGSGDLLLAGSVVLRNWFALVVGMAVFALMVLSLFTMLRFSLEARLHEWMPQPVSWGLLWVSPWFFAALVVLVLFGGPPACAYWLVHDKKQIWERVFRWTLPVAAVAAGIWWGWRAEVHDSTVVTAFRVLAVVSGLTMVRFWIALFGARNKAAKQADKRPRVRNRLSRGLTRALIAVAALALLGTVDTIGQSLLLLTEGARTGAVSVYAVLMAVATFFRRHVVSLVTRFRANERPPLPVNLLTYAGATVLLLGVLGAVAVLPHWAIWSGVPMAPTVAIATRVEFDPLGALPVLLFVSVLISLVMGRIWPFVNRSSLHALYEARLRRAYMGASNPMREGSRQTVTDPVVGDDLDLTTYRPEKNGGPIHLINVTVNETVSGRSQVQQQDRKGMGMAIGPGGVSVSRRHHAYWDREESQPPARGNHRTSKEIRQEAERFNVFARASGPEPLGVGQWIAISGAAFSTGLGSRTNFGLSLLAGLFNVRLGYWWGSEIDPKARAKRPERSIPQHVGGVIRKVFPAQLAFLDEWFARFPGVALRQWYLSDGGHFENLGGYELIRRRLPFIVVCDNEQDVDYTFSGLANLVRKARIDFGATIEFLDETELAQLPMQDDLRKWIGTPESLRRGRWADEPVPGQGASASRVTQLCSDSASLSHAHASLARVTYHDDSQGILLYIKPTLVGDEPADVLQYHCEHPEFPQQTTADQFFDEAQWESYRCLGHHIAKKLFQQNLSGWSPAKEMQWQKKTEDDRDTLAEFLVPRESRSQQDSGAPATAEG